MLICDFLLMFEVYVKICKVEYVWFVVYKCCCVVVFGNYLCFLFEDEMMICYQIQEMLYIEKIFDEVGIEGEFDVYLLLVFDGINLKVMMQIEYEYEIEWCVVFVWLIGVEDCVYLWVDGYVSVYVIVDEDFECDNVEKMLVVYFVCFEFDVLMCVVFKGGVVLLIGCDYLVYMMLLQWLDVDVIVLLVGDLCQCYGFLVLCVVYVVCVFLF